MSSAAQFEECIRRGGVVLFPSDTVYGLACDPGSEAAVRRLYEIKGRPSSKASAVMFFSLDAALAAFAPHPGLGARTRTALHSLMPGGVTVLLENPSHLWPLACAGDPETLGLRVVDVPALRGVSVGVMQSSANLAGGAEAHRLADVAESIRAAVDLEIDGGELPGRPSTVVDLRGYERDGSWSVVRAGAVDEAALEAALSHQFHFDPSTYSEMIRQDIPVFDELQEQVASVVAAGGASRILELGTGTGETARRLLERHPEAVLVGVDESPGMLQRAREVLGEERVELRVARLQDPLPAGPFDLVVSVLCVHHLDASEKRDLFRRVRDALAAEGAFVLGDVVVVDDPAEARTALTPGYDMPDSAEDQLAWLREAGFSAEVAWRDGDLAVISARPTA